MESLILLYFNVVSLAIANWTLSVFGKMQHGHLLSSLLITISRNLIPQLANANEASFRFRALLEQHAILNYPYSTSRRSSLLMLFACRRSNDKTFPFPNWIPSFWCASKFLPGTYTTSGTKLSGPNQISAPFFIRIVCHQPSRTGGETTPGAHLAFPLINY